MLQIFVDNQPLELYTDEKINFTFQCNDIAELKDRQTNYTNAFNIPKTPHNIRIFNGLGLPSDTSSIPYEKPNCVVKYGGIDIISKGWMHITETAEDYKCHIYSGIIDIFKAIGNKTLGDLDLVSLGVDHKKTTENVLKYSTYTHINYPIADYNGETHFKIGEETVINSDPLIPCISAMSLLVAINENNFGTTEEPINFVINPVAFPEGDDSLKLHSKLTELMLTYPKTTELQETDNKIEINSNIVSSIWDYNGSRLPEYWFFIFNKEKAESGEMAKLFDMVKYPRREFRGYVYDAYGYFKVKESGVYQFDFSGDNFPDLMREMYITHGNFTNPTLTPREAFDLSERYGRRFKFQYNNERKYHIDGNYVVNLTAGDIIYFGFNRFNNILLRFEKHNFTLKINKLSGDEVSFTNELKQYAIKDFLKDIFVMYGLTIMPGHYYNIKGCDNIYKLLTIEDRIKCPVVDLSKHYIERTSERYIHNNYAQHNTFKWQYNDKEDNHNDGEITINNLNIDLNKDIYASKVYSPENSLPPFPIGELIRNVPIMKFYEQQTKEQDGVIKIEYKPLEKRFHFLKTEMIETPFKISSKKTDNGKIYEGTKICVANFNGLDWQSLLNENYRLLGSLVENAKIHEIDLDLDIITASQMRFDRVYYFQQEQQYYLLNKLNFDTDGKAKGEFIRIDNYLSIVATDNNVEVEEIVPPAIGMYRSYGDRLPDYHEGQDTNIELHIDGHGANPTSLEWEKWKADGTWEVFAQATAYNAVTLSVGKNSFRLKATHGDIVKLSNEVTYINMQCKEFVFSYAGYEPEHIGEVDYIDCNGEEKKITLTYDESDGRDFQVSLCAREILSHNGYVVDATNYASQNNC